jgi:hypothetical protein
MHSDVDDDTIWAQFCSDMTYHKLRWEVMPRSPPQVNFLYTTITIAPNGCINTKLFEKALNL